MRKKLYRALLIFSASMATGVQAQEALLQGYPGVSRALEGAKQAQEKNQLDLSLNRLGEAQNRFNRFVPDIGAKVLVSGIETALENAKIAVNRSQADLGAQLGLVQGLLRRVLQEEFLNQVEAQGPYTQGFARLVAQDYGMSSTTQNQLLKFANQGNVEGVRVVVQKQAAQKMLSSLKAAVGATDKRQKFLNTALASGWFMDVQGAPEVVDIETETFSEALVDLTSGSMTSFTDRVSQLNKSTAVLVVALDPTRVPDPSPVLSDPTPDPKTAPIKTTPQNQTPVPNPTPITSASEGLYTSLSKALVAVADADVLKARDQIKNAQEAYIAKLSGQIDGQINERILSLFEKLQNPMSSIGLRITDIEGLIAEVSSAEGSIGQGPTGVTMRSNVSGLWSGGLRAFLFIVIGLLSFLPLHYLNLAFGGRNKYWRFIGIAMTLLFIPAIVEGIAQLGSLLAELWGVHLFDLLGSLSVLQNPIAQLIWAALFLVACGFAIAGFRGICIQFGLIRSGKYTYFTQLETTTGSNTEGPGPETDKKNASWDEEF